MNKDQLVKSVGFHVRLVPAPITRQGMVADEDWIVRRVETDRVELERTVAGHVKTLGIDQIHHFSTDPERDACGVRHGFYNLLGQIIIDGPKVVFDPAPSPRTRTQPDPARLALMDSRLKMVMDDYQHRGRPHAMIDSFTDLSKEEKAALFERAVMLKKGHAPRENPYRNAGSGVRMDLLPEGLEDHFKYIPDEARTGNYRRYYLYLYPRQPGGSITSQGEYHHEWKLTDTEWAMSSDPVALERRRRAQETEVFKEIIRQDLAREGKRLIINEEGVVKV
jgi:hypothetical protein